MAGKKPRTILHSLREGQAKAIFASLIDQQAMAIVKEFKHTPELKAFFTETYKLPWWKCTKESKIRFISKLPFVERLKLLELSGLDPHYVPTFTLSEIMEMNDDQRNYVNHAKSEGYYPETHIRNDGTWLLPLELRH